MALAEFAKAHGLGSADASSFPPTAVCSADERPASFTAPRPARSRAASPGRSATSPTPTAPTTRPTPSSARRRSCGSRSRSASRPTWARRSSGGIGLGSRSVELEGGGSCSRIAGRQRRLADRALLPRVHRSGCTQPRRLRLGARRRRPLRLAPGPPDRPRPSCSALCGDAAHIATTIREECLEEVDSGEAKRSAAKRRRPTPGRPRELDPGADHLRPPARRRRVVTAAVPPRGDRHPGTYLTALFADPRCGWSPSTSSAAASTASC